MKQLHIRHVINGIFYKTARKIDNKNSFAYHAACQAVVRDRPNHWRDFYNNIFILNNFNPGWVRTGNLFSEESIFFDVRYTHKLSKFI